MFPRYFVPRDTEPTLLPAPLPARMVQLRDHFRIGEGGPESVVTADMKGNLYALEQTGATALPTGLRQALIHHETVQRRPPRTLDVSELWLFDPQAVEQPVNSPGVNDPVVVHGTLYGPFGGPGPASRVDGRLTVTRGDILAGLVEELAYALHVHGPNGEDERCLHLLLPGDTAEVIARGEGVILAWPAHPVEIDATDIANEGLCKRLLYDVLAGFQDDLRAADPKAPMATRVLPHPSRADLEQALAADGWEVRGDRAVRLDPSLKKGFGSLLTSVLGVPDAMTRALPPEGSLDELVAAARDALATLPGWPDARARALRERVLGESASVARVPRGAGLAPPEPRASATAVAPERVIPPPSRAPHWADDFGGTPVAPARPRAAPPPAPSRAPNADAPPDLMNDFASPVPSEGRKLPSPPPPPTRKR